MFTLSFPTTALPNLSFPRAGNQEISKGHGSALASILPSWWRNKEWQKHVCPGPAHDDGLWYWPQHSALVQRSNRRCRAMKQEENLKKEQILFMDHLPRSHSSGFTALYSRQAIAWRSVAGKQPPRYPVILAGWGEQANPSEGHVHQCWGRQKGHHGLEWDGRLWAGTRAWRCGALS